MQKHQGETVSPICECKVPGVSDVQEVELRLRRPEPLQRTKAFTIMQYGDTKGCSVGK